MTDLRNSNSDQTPVMIAGHPVLFLPHYVPAIGPRVFVVNEHPDANNYSPEDARLYAAHLKIAADQAESMARRAAKKMSTITDKEEKRV